MHRQHFGSRAHDRTGEILRAVENRIARGGEDGLCHLAQNAFEAGVNDGKDDWVDVRNPGVQGPGHQSDLLVPQGVDHQGRVVGGQQHRLYLVAGSPAVSVSGRPWQTARQGCDDGDMSSALSMPASLPSRVACRGSFAECTHETVSGKVGQLGNVGMRDESSADAIIWALLTATRRQARRPRSTRYAIWSCAVTVRSGAGARSAL